MTTLLRPKLPRTGPDVSVENHGSIFLVRPISYRAAQWLDANIGEHQTFGDAVVVEHPYICDVIDGMLNDGLEVGTMSKLTLNRVMAAVERDDNSGFCTACGAQASGVEPDARKYTCESCGEPKVFGAEELLLMVSQ